ncbi:MAG: site-specific DNA-methyltransferase [Bacilli bacterium]|nr:site-specific DNA-methyltransferase [Bacilli bacterium]MCI2054727.1 site-specific DNA-methyltransferase [Bacilli bacterium]
MLDFFAGSGTTGQAVMELNKEDGGHRRFILCTNNENSICETITYPRLKTVMSGFRKDGSKYGDGIKANLFYFKTDFVNDSKNRDQAKYSLVEKCNGLLSILEDCFILKDKATNYFEYSDCGDKRMFIYNDFYSKKPFDEMKEKIKKETGKKILYIFSTDDDLSPFDLSDLTDVEVKPIPTKIYEIYKEIVEDIKRGE